uniref:H15 domain-containing protein n=1 Tax=Heterorhabditis bacteriophora TaxID=37862 RepID=A0A1I7XMJ0_HETBA
MSSSPANAKASKTSSKKVSSHPTYSAMIKKAITTLNEKGGTSKIAILKYICQNYKVGDNLTKVNAHLRLAIKREVASGTLKQVKGTGAAGSFKLGEKTVAKTSAVKKTEVQQSAASEKKPKKLVTKKVSKPKSPKKGKIVKTSKRSKKVTGTKKVKTPKKTAARPKVSKPKSTKKTSTPKKA